MPATSKVRPDRGLYQPRLPLPGDPGIQAAKQGHPKGTVGRKSTTNRRRIMTAGRDPSLGIPTPQGPRRDGGQSWRLDEKTRRAGRQGVAAARAALACAVRPETGRQADAA
jgi:hypothetical protein